MVPHTDIHPHTDIQIFRVRCGQLFSQMYEQTRPGYLGQVEISCRMPTNVFMIEIQEFPISYLQIENDVAKQWHPRNGVSYLTHAQDTIADLVDFAEEIIFKIYQDSGHGSMLVKFWYSEHLRTHKVVFHWLVSYRKTA